MADEEFNPAEHTAAEVKAQLEEATEAEKNAIVAAERQSGKPRKSVLSAAGVDPDQRTDASGRVLHPWESVPKAPEN